jgi:site-specific DNA-methyltransferase (adenine-specific)
MASKKSPSIGDISKERRNNKKSNPEIQIDDFNDSNLEKILNIKKNKLYSDCIKNLDLKPFYRNDSQVIFNADINSIKSKKGFIDLIVTSPPYNLDINYNSNDDKLEYNAYLKFTYDWLKVCYKLSKDDGRLCLNIPLDKNKGGVHSIYADITSMAKKAGWNYFTTIVWNEGNISRRTAWGSWMSASAPYIIAPVEMIVVFYKKYWKKIEKGKSTIERQEFLDWTNGLWSFNGESKKRIGHPAPFPLELPNRCIKMFSYEYDIVFDPFLGSGTTMISASKNNRFSIGIDIDRDYCLLAKKRIIKANLEVLDDSKSTRTDTVLLQTKPKKRHTA